MLENVYLNNGTWNIGDEEYPTKCTIPTRIEGERTTSISMDSALFAVRIVSACAEVTLFGSLQNYLTWAPIYTRNIVSAVKFLKFRCHLVAANRGTRFPASYLELCKPVNLFCHPPKR